MSNASRAGAPGPGEAPPDRVELPVRRALRHRALFLGQALQDGPGALTLIAAAAGALRAPRSTADVLLALAELGVGAWVLRFVVQGGIELFGRGGRPALDVDPAVVTPLAEAVDPPRVRWEGVAVGLLAAVEVWHHWAQTGQFKRPTAVVAVATLAFALGLSDWIRRRTGRREQLAVSPEGVRYRGGNRARERFAARWDEVERVEHAPGALRLVLRDGRQWALRAHEHLDGDALVRAAQAAVTAHAPARLVASTGPALSPP